MMTEPQTEVQIRLPKRTPKQVLIDRGSKRFNVYRCGRRFGKDVLMERRAIVRTQSMPIQGWYAPFFRMMEENFESIKRRLYPIITRAPDSEHVIELANGAKIDFWSLENFESSRGRKYHWVTINEAAQFKNLELAYNSVIRATMADYHGGLDMGSTPRGLNFFYRFEQQIKNDPEGAAFHFSSYDNPHIDRAELDAIRATLPKPIADQEIMALYVEDGAFFPNVDDVCVVDHPDDPRNHVGHSFSAGLDWGQVSDFSSLTILCDTCHKSVDWWRGNRTEFIQQRAIIVQTVKRWPGCRMLPERNSIGAPNIEMLVADGLVIEAGPDKGLGFYTTSITKAEIIAALHLSMARKEVLWPRAYAEEFRAYEMEITSANPKFNAPSGGHDDTVISSALALRVATYPIQVFI